MSARDKCHEIAELLSSFHDDEVSPAERRMVEEHLPACVACRERRDSLSQVTQLVRSMPPAAVPPGFYEKLEQAVAKERLGLLPAPAWRSSAFGAILPMCAGVAAFVALVTFKPVAVGEGTGPMTAMAPAPAVSEVLKNPVTESLPVAAPALPVAPLATKEEPRVELAKAPLASNPVPPPAAPAAPVAAEPVQVAVAPAPPAPDSSLGLSPSMSTGFIKSSPAPDTALEAAKELAPVPSVAPIAPVTAERPWPEGVPVGKLVRDALGEQLTLVFGLEALEGTRENETYDRLLVRVTDGPRFLADLRQTLAGKSGIVQVERALISPEELDLDVVYLGPLETDEATFMGLYESLGQSAAVQGIATGRDERSQARRRARIIVPLPAN